MSPVMVQNAPQNHGGNIKKQIRDTTRLLSRPTLPADLRTAQERKLKALQLALEQQAKGQVERKMAQRYRMVKFFERKKALARSAQASRALEAAANEQAYAEALEKLRSARTDLFYVLHYPRDRKYIALYPTNNHAAMDAGVEEERRKLREEISRQVMAEAKVDSIELVPLPKAAHDDENDEEEDAVASHARTAFAPSSKQQRMMDSEEDIDDDEDDEEDDDDEEEEDGDDEDGDEDSDDEDDDDDINDDSDDLSDSFEDDNSEDLDDDEDDEDEDDEDDSQDEDDEDDSQDEDDDDDDEEEEDFADSEEFDSEDDEEDEPASKKRKH